MSDQMGLFFWYPLPSASDFFPSSNPRRWDSADIAIGKSTVIDSNSRSQKNCSAKQKDLWIWPLLLFAAFIYYRCIFLPVFQDRVAGIDVEMLSAMH